MRTFLERFVRRTGAWGLAGLLFLLVGVVMLPFGIASQIQNQHFRSTAKSTTGLVTTQRDLGGRGGGTAINFSYTVNGRHYTAAETAPNFAKLAGTRQTVLYNPARPSEARLANSNLTNEGEAFGVSLFFVVAAPVLMLIGFAWRAIRRRFAA